MQHESRGPRDGAAWLLLGPSATRIPSKFQDPRSARLRVRAGHDRVTCPLCTGDSSCLRTKPEPDCCPTCSWLPHASAWACSLPGPWASEQAQPTRPREPRRKTTPEVVPRGSPGMPSSRPKGNGRRFAPELTLPSRRRTQGEAVFPQATRNFSAVRRSVTGKRSTTPLLEAGSCVATGPA